MVRRCFAVLALLAWVAWVCNAMDGFALDVDVGMPEAPTTLPDLLDWVPQMLSRMSLDSRGGHALAEPSFNI